MEELKNQLSRKMENSRKRLSHELAGVRTGRASLALLEGVTVDYYGTQTPLSQVAALGLPDNRTISIQPWEQKMVPDVEKAILAANIGLTPQSADGKTIRIAMPQLTGERRKELVRFAKKMAEDARVAIRNVRREGMESVKKKEKDKEISEDEKMGLHDEIQKLTDKFIKEVDGMIEKKETEILEE